MMMASDGSRAKVIRNCSEIVSHWFTMLHNLQLYQSELIGILVVSSVFFWNHKLPVLGKSLVLKMFRKANQNCRRYNQRIAIGKHVELLPPRSIEYRFASFVALK